jgi:hypothetical protein
MNRFKLLIETLYGGHYGEEQYTETKMVPSAEGPYVAYDEAKVYYDAVLRVQTAKKQQRAKIAEGDSRLAEFWAAEYRTALLALENIDVQPETGAGDSRRDVERL